MNKYHILFIFAISLSFVSRGQSANDYYMLGKNYELLNDCKTAIKKYSKAIELEPKFEDAYISKASAENTLKKYKDAIQDLTAALVINPESAKVYYLRAINKSQLNDTDGTLEDLDKCIKTDPSFSRAYNDRAEVKFELSQKESACKDLEKAASLGYPYPFDYIEKKCLQ